MSAPEDPPPRVSKEKLERISANNKRLKQEILDSGVDPLAKLTTRWVVKGNPPPSYDPFDEEAKAKRLAKLWHRNRINAGLSLLESLYIGNSAGTPKPESDVCAFYFEWLPISYDILAQLTEDVQYILDLADTEIQNYEKLAEELADKYRKALEENRRMVAIIKEKTEEFLRRIAQDKLDWDVRLLVASLV
jgi:Txe/YoeB family toxin of Txe-Axe toxin-antitoxin module